jgi:general secretion pathway protein K
MIAKRPRAGFFAANTATRSRLLRSIGCYILFTYIKFDKHFITNLICKSARAGGPKNRVPGPLRQSGVALITAILVVALASIAAAAILSSANIAIHRSGNLQDSEKAWWYATGVESWVKTILKRDAQNNRNDSFADDWAKPVDYLPVDEGFIRGRVEDLQGRFNLNNFGVPLTAAAAGTNLYLKYVAVFERLLQNLNVDPSLAKPLADAIHDWIDKDDQPTGFDGAEDSEYLSRTPPYRTPGRAMTSVSEVLAIKGMTKELYDKLTHCATTKSGTVSCITALPAYPTPINLNTAPEPLLRALPKQPSAGVDVFLRSRDTKPYTTANDVFQAPPLGFLTSNDVDASMVGVQSNYFLLRAETFIGSGRVALYSFYYRPASGAAIVLGRSTDIE